MNRVRKTLGGVACAAGLATLISAQSADAQSVNGWALDRYEPTPAGDVFFMSEHPWYSSTRRFAVGLFGDYAANPLVLRQTFADGSTARTRVVSDMLVGHLSGAVSFADRVGITLALPVSLYQDGSSSQTATTTLGPASGLGLGDIQIGARVRLFNQSDRDPVSLHLGATLYFPTGKRDHNTGDENFRFEPRAVLAGRASILRWSFTTSFMVRPGLDAVNIGVGNELRFSGALGFTFLNDRFTVGPEAYVATAIRDLPGGRTGNAAFTDAHWGGEVILGAHYLIADTVLVGLGGGFGMARGYGVPAGRALFSVAYAPVTREPDLGPSDRDGDQVLDPDDLCPDTPAGANPDPARRGCPLNDTDGDLVLDPDDLCVTVPAGDHPDPERRGCPTPDSDNDLVLDPQDQCVTTPQGPHPDPERPGCPDGDLDHDTYLDHADRCPDVSAGAHPDPARPGCPQPDGDHDLVPDGDDRCPTVPGAPSSDATQNGCPVHGVSVGSGHIHILEPVFFDTDLDVIKARSFPVLEAVADVLRSTPYIRRVRIEGHTDDRASREHNLDLSQRRAASVMRWLSEHGVEASRLEAQGFGPDRPVVSNQTREGRARNRRVEFIITDPAQQNNTVTGSAATSDPGDIHDSRGRH